MLSYLAYVMRFTSDITDSYGETLVLSALRLLQDCPSHGVVMRRVSSLNHWALNPADSLSFQELMVVFRHLMGTPHRRALFDSLDKLLDEKVLLGTSIASQEALRYGDDFWAISVS